MNKRTFVTIILAAAVLPGCPYGPLDVLGNETVVTDESHNSTEPEDDRIEDIHLRHAREVLPSLVVFLHGPGI